MARMQIDRDYINLESRQKASWDEIAEHRRFLIRTRLQAIGVPADLISDEDVEWYARFLEFEVPHRVDSREVLDAFLWGVNRAIHAHLRARGIDPGRYEMTVEGREVEAGEPDLFEVRFRVHARPDSIKVDLVPDGGGATT